MDRILFLKKEHHEIGEYLLELENLIDQEFLDVSRFSQDFYQMIDLLNRHERKEKYFFEKMKMQNPVLEDDLYELNFLHERIKGHLKVIDDAIKSQNIAYLKLALDNDGRMFISQVRNHFHKEEEVFDKILFLHLIERKEEIRERKIVFR